MKYLGAIAASKDLITKEYADASRIWYGVCSTAAATQAKTVTIDGITALTTGLFILVSFTNNQGYNGAPTLNLNSLGAKTIRRLTGTSAARYEWLSGEILPLVYNGTYWVILDGGLATTTYYGATKLETSATSTSIGTALTPASLNSLAQYMLSGVGVYSASATYAVGAKVRYGYYIYECITAITTAEAWTAAHWKALAPLQTQIDELGGGVFIATYGTTTSAEIEAAYQAGKVILCVKDTLTYLMTYRQSATVHNFTTLTAINLSTTSMRGYHLKCTSNAWTESGAVNYPSTDYMNTQISDAIDGAIFRAVYGTTTSAEIEAAYQANKLIYCIYNARVYYLVWRNSATNHQFTNVYSNTRYSVACSNDTWTNASGTL